MFESTKIRDIPFVDVLSWVFGNSDFDHDKPVILQRFCKLLMETEYVVAPR